MGVQNAAYISLPQPPRFLPNFAMIGGKEKVGPFINRLGKAESLNADYNNCKVKASA